MSRAAKMIGLDASYAAPKPPHGAQEYKGNGLHDWETAASAIARLRVPGGWIYRSSSHSIAFVPFPEGAA